MKLGSWIGVVVVLQGTRSCLWVCGFQGSFFFLRYEAKKDV